MNSDIDKNDVKNADYCFEKSEIIHKKEKTAVGKSLLLSGFSGVINSKKRGT